MTRDYLKRPFLFLSCITVRLALCLIAFDIQTSSQASSAQISSQFSALSSCLYMGPSEPEWAIAHSRLPAMSRRTVVLFMIYNLSVSTTTSLINMQKNGLDKNPVILTSRLVNNPFILLDFTLHHFWSSLRRISLFEPDF